MTVYVSYARGQGWSIWIGEPPTITGETGKRWWCGPHGDPIRKGEGWPTPRKPTLYKAILGPLVKVKEVKP